ncbi:uncharacterized protein LOC115936517 [Leptonychotes weddellii]|uniref:Uncharacterized protein LOC115936517 n=1 Tax=Leptonychotes weddellii TaxID=9713 RepID=A0A7F8PV94_LEPWE|nr:uncharacterized protein LOC115936517 [Leptonychotes weddellii]
MEHNHDSDALFCLSVADVAAIACGREFLVNSSRVLLDTILQLLGDLKPGQCTKLKVSRDNWCSTLRIIQSCGHTLAFVQLLKWQTPLQRLGLYCLCSFSFAHYSPSPAESACCSPLLFPPDHPATFPSFPLHLAHRDPIMEHTRQQPQVPRHRFPTLQPWTSHWPPFLQPGLPSDAGQEGSQCSHTMSPSPGPKLLSDSSLCPHQSPLLSSQWLGQTSDSVTLATLLFLSPLQTGSQQRLSFLLPRENGGVGVNFLTTLPQ